ASGAGDPVRRIEWLLEADEDAAALSEAHRAIAAEAAAPERWFEVSARLTARLPERPAWLEALQAARGGARGGLAEAQERLRRVIDRDDGAPEEKRRARLRSAELSALLGQTADAGREAAGWLRAHTEAPASERARALCLDASMRSRRGDFDAALDRVAEAEAAASSLPVAERPEA